jgi:hypothetical protein
MKIVEEDLLQIQAKLELAFRRLIAKEVVTINLSEK